MGDWHTCGLTNGTARCWGFNANGECTVPAITGGWKALIAGWYHTCGILLADNSAQCWGYNDYGHCNVPAVTGGWKSLAAGGWHTVARAASSSPTTPLSAGGATTTA